MSEETLKQTQTEEEPMRVADLISELQKLDPRLRIYSFDDEGGRSFVYKLSEGKVLINNYSRDIVFIRGEKR